MPSDSDSSLTNLSYDLRASRLISKGGRAEGLTPQSNATRISNLVPRFDLSRFNPEVGNPLPLAFRFAESRAGIADNTPDFGPPRNFRCLKRA